MPLDELYFTWLYGQVGSVKERNPSKTYWTLLRILFTKKFVCVVRNDENRAEDGRYLRHEFLECEELDPNQVDENWMSLECSFLEMLVALARRIAFDDDSDPRRWFWELIENLNLEHYHDNAIFHEDQIHEVIDRVIFRKYDRNGSGGLFPLRRAVRDQRKLELWYQASAYLLEESA